ncbi:MAG: hypothetical protein IJ949_03180, partial [Oscillospiraceae bacterium]|nr:hypothetical protein [Oscillospiraceae bacterium]
MVEITDAFLAEYKCVTHDDIFIINNFGGSHTNDAIAAAVAAEMGIDTSVYALTVAEGEVPNGGCGRGQYDYEDLVFRLTDIATGTYVEFATGVVCMKFYESFDHDNGEVRGFHADPIYVLKTACPEDISSVTTPKIAEAAINALPEEYTADSITVESLWTMINDALDFEEK